VTGGAWYYGLLASVLGMGGRCACEAPPTDQILCDFKGESAPVFAGRCI
jgi:hypothetical protein